MTNFTRIIKKAFKNKEFEHIINVCSGLLKKNSGFQPAKIALASALSGQGLEFSAKNHDEQALAKHEEALSVTPNNRVVLLNKAFLLIKLERYSEAFNLADKALKQDLSFHPAKIAVVEALSGQGAKLFADSKYQEALVICEKTLKIFPSDSTLVANKAFLLFKLKNCDDALKLSEMSLGLDSNCLLAKITKACALSNQELNFATEAEYDEFLKEHTPVQDISPTPSQILANKSCIFFQLKDFEKAFLSSQESLKLDPDCYLANIIFFKSLPYKLRIMDKTSYKLTSKGNAEEAAAMYKEFEILEDSQKKENAKNTAIQQEYDDFFLYGAGILIKEEKYNSNISDKEALKIDKENEMETEPDTDAEISENLEMKENAKNTAIQQEYDDFFLYGPPVNEWLHELPYHKHIIGDCDCSH